ncbi:MAG: YihY/virulence factor BrkB family protein [Actinomycetes bacterium]
MSIGSVVQKARDAWSAVMGTRPGRAWQHYLDHRANLLAGGIAYMGLFSIGASLVVGFTLLNAVMGNHHRFRDQVVAAVNQQLPGLLDVGSSGGLVPPQDFFGTGFTSWAGISALLVALYTGLGWLDAVRGGVRTVFGCPKDTTFILLKKLKDVVVLATIGLAIVLSAVLGVGVNAAADWLLGFVGLAGSVLGNAVLRVLAVLVVLLVDMAVFMVLFRLLSGLRLPWRRLRAGAFVGAVGAGLLQLFGGVLLHRAGGSNPLLAGSAVLVGLLLWMNLLSRVTLFAAAWTATSDEAVQEQEAASRPAASAAAAAVGGPQRLRVPVVRRVPLAPTYGQRDADRVTLAAGAVLGALALASFRVLGGAARSARDLVRAPLD